MRSVFNRIFILLILCVYLSMAACRSEPEFGINGGDSKKLSKITCAIGLKFIDSEVGKNYHYSILKGKLTLREVSPFPPSILEQIPWIYTKKDVPNGLPVIEGFSYYGAYQLSQDDSIFALSISLNNDFVPKEFVLISSSTNAILFQRKSDHPLSVKSLAWSPDSNLLAVLDSSTSRSFGFMSILSAMAGHPVSIYSFYLSVYDRKGQLLVTTKIASGIVGGGCQVFWEKN